MSQISQIYLCIKWQVEGKLGESRKFFGGYVQSVRINVEIMAS